MSPNQHDSKPQRRNSDSPHGTYWWAVRVGAVCGAIIGVSAVWAIASKTAAIPLRSEISAAADTADRWPSSIRMRTRIETDYRSADDSLRNVTEAGNRAVMSELRDIHSLLLEQRRR